MFSDVQIVHWDLVKKLGTTKNRNLIINNLNLTND